MLDVKFMADTKIADSKRAFELQKSAFSEEVNIKVRSLTGRDEASSWLRVSDYLLTPIPASDSRSPAGL